MKKDIHAIEDLIMEDLFRKMELSLTIEVLSSSREYRVLQQDQFNNVCVQICEQRS